MLRNRTTGAECGFVLPGARVVIWSVLGFAGCCAVIDVADLLGVSAATADGVIYDVSFQAQHQENGSSRHMSARTVPDTWWLDVRFDGGRDVLKIQHAPWDWEQKGSRVEVEYAVGRLTGDVHVSGIRNPDGSAGQSDP